MRAILKRVLTPPLVLVAAALILLEETLIEWAQRLMAWLATHPYVAALEARAKRLPPYPAMILFLLPGAVLLPVKLAAVWLLATGHIVLGTLIILFGKAASTALGARIYLILRPTLVTLAWFARAEAWVFRWRDRIYARVKAMPAWQKATAAVRAAKAWLRANQPASGLARSPLRRGTPSGAARLMAVPALRDIVADDDLAVLSCAEMRVAESLAMEGLSDENGTVAPGVSSSELMETAGAAVAAVIERYLPQPVVVLCGPGNNGGDGLVVARHLAAEGWPVRVGLLGERERLTGDALNAAELWANPIEAATPALLDEHPLVVDALFGIGLKRPLDGMALELVSAINARDLVCVAVDVPSGLDADTGLVLGGVPRCELTVTFFRPKAGHLSLAGRTCCGELRVAEIGVPRGVLGQMGIKQWRNGPGLWRQALRRPALDDHKYRRGHVVVFGGDSMTGAARLAALAARRIGAGLVSIAGSPAATTIYRLAEPGNLVVDLPDGRALGELAADARKNVFVVGPGAGTGAQTAERLMAALAAGRGTVIDADAITVAAQAPERLFAAISGQTLLTPHEGEFARLFPDLAGLPSKLDRARHAARRSGATVLLKGADTTIAAPDGRAIITNNAPATLATAGSGDVLAGMAGGLMAQGMTAFAAAAAASWLHGEVAQRFGVGLIAEDIAPLLPTVLSDLWHDLPVQDGG